MRHAAPPSDPPMHRPTPPRRSQSASVTCFADLAAQAPTPPPRSRPTHRQKCHLHGHYRAGDRRHRALAAATVVGVMLLNQAVRGHSDHSWGGRRTGEGPDGRGDGVVVGCRWALLVPAPN